MEQLSHLVSSPPLRLFPRYRLLHQFSPVLVMQLARHNVLQYSSQQICNRTIKIGKVGSDCSTHNMNSIDKLHYRNLIREIDNIKKYIFKPQP